MLLPIWVSQRCVGCHSDAIIATIVNKILLHESRPDFHLVDHRLHRAALYDALELIHVEIRDTNTAHQTQLHELHHRGPCVDVIDVAVNHIGIHMYPI